MDKEILRPRSVYLPESIIAKLKSKAKHRQESTFVRNAIIAALDGINSFDAGYNKGLRDACKVIQDTKEASILLIGNDRLSDILIENIKMLEQNGK